MKNFFKKIRPYNFWVGLSAALVLLLNSLGKAFGFEIENQVVEDVVMSIAGVLAVFGIVTGKPTKDEKSDENQNEENENDENDEK